MGKTGQFNSAYRNALAPNLFIYVLAICLCVCDAHILTVRHLGLKSPKFHPPILRFEANFMIDRIPGLAGIAHIMGSAPIESFQSIAAAFNQLLHTI